VILQFHDHPGFQRAAFAAIGAGGLLAVLLPFFEAPRPSWILAAGVALPLGWGALARGASQRRRVFAALAVIGALAVARLARESLLPDWEIVGGVAAGLAGVLTGLVGVLGMVPRHLELRRDPVARALAEARPLLGGEELVLAERAMAAEARIRAALAADQVAEAETLQRLARTVALGAVAQARKVRVLADTAAAGDWATIAQRIEVVERQRAGAADEGTARAYDGALAALRDQHAHLQAITTTADRLRAHLHGQVALLEGTALALAARRGALAADEAANLTPLVDRLKEVSSHAHAEAAALATL
jgi:hypothetical protein